VNNLQAYPGHHITCIPQNVQCRGRIGVLIIAVRTTSGTSVCADQRGNHYMERQNLK